VCANKRWTLHEWVPAYGTHGGSAEFTAQSFSIQMKSTGGYAISAIVQHLDVNGNVISSVALTDPALLAPVAATKFAVGLQVQDETNLIFSNPSTTDSATITLARMTMGGLKFRGRHLLHQRKWLFRRWEGFQG
jgi:hypothetical protein